MIDRGELDQWLRERDYALVTRADAARLEGALGLPGVVPWDEHRRALAKADTELAGLRARVAQLEDDRGRILAAERGSRLSFERARDAQARMAIRLDECRARAAQFETAGRALLDGAARMTDGFDQPAHYELDAAVIDEFRAVLDGNATPTDREDPTDA